MHVRLPLLVSACLLSVSAREAGGNEKLAEDMRKATLVQARQAAPDFSCPQVDGRAFALSAQRGKVVVLYFFSTQVGVCITQMKYLQEEVFKKLQGRADFELLAVGRGHTREELVRMAGENRLTLPMAADPEGGVFGRYFSKFVPRLVVLGRDGKIAYLESGYREFQSTVALQQVLQRELSRPAR